MKEARALPRILWLMAMVIVLGTVIAAPANDPVIPPSNWNGYGVDWCYESLRLGIALKDSLLSPGCMVGDSIWFDYAEFDELVFSSISTANITITGYLDADSINAPHRTGTDMVLTGYASVDSLEADHHVGVDGDFGSLRTGALATDSAATVTLRTNLVSLGAATGTDEDVVITMDVSGAPLDVLMYDEGESRVEVPQPFWASSVAATGNSVFDAAVSADSIEADHHVGVNAVFSGPVSADSVEADHFRGGVTANFRYLSSTGALNLTSSNTYADGETAGTDISVAIYNSGNHGTLNLPSAATIDGRVLFITSTLHVTIDPNGAERIHGAATFDIYADDSIWIWSDGSNWWILASYSI